MSPIEHYVNITFVSCRFCKRVKLSEVYLFLNKVLREYSTSRYAKYSID